MDVSASVAAWIAVGAAAVALVAVAVAVTCWFRLGRVRAAQRVLLAGGRADMVDFAVSLQGRIDDLHRAVVRYDAYENTGGQQSVSVALLDGSRSGVVVTAIQGRDYARIYVKELERGRSSVPLSPEEQEALDRAMR